MSASKLQVTIEILLLLLAKKISECSPLDSNSITRNILHATIPFSNSDNNDSVSLPESGTNFEITDSDSYLTTEFDEDIPPINEHEFTLSPRFDTNENPGNESSIFPAEIVSETTTMNNKYTKPFLLDRNISSIEMFISTGNIKDGEEAINSVRQQLNTLQKWLQPKQEDMLDIEESENFEHLENRTRTEMWINETQILLTALENIQNLSARIDTLSELFDKNKNVSEQYNNMDYDIDLLYNEIDGEREEINLLTEYIEYAKRVRQYLEDNDCIYILDGRSVKHLLNIANWKRILEGFNESLVDTENILELHKKVDLLDYVINTSINGDSFLCRDIWKWVIVDNIYKA
ncbi:hypothetical protein L9F63_018151 [Diploptera punctata]|uniref:Uncharacterized protein n=1 Tax=Diploptera punctata TaxID=6984 RepID=A0AAD7ZXK9_DIPPU|nr:hypothetical protein L9F63_018151 [Diploptera punctata]